MIQAARCSNVGDSAARCVRFIRNRACAGLNSAAEIASRVTNAAGNSAYCAAGTAKKTAAGCSASTRDATTSRWYRKIVFRSGCERGGSYRREHRVDGHFLAMAQHGVVQFKGEMRALVGLGARVNLRDFTYQFCAAWKFCAIGECCGLGGSGKHLIAYLRMPGVKIFGQFC